MQRIKSIFLILFIVLGLDQSSKIIARRSLKFGPADSYLGDSFRIQLSQNAGAFLSLGAELGESARFWIFTMAVALFLGVLAWSLFRKKDMGKISTIGLAFVLAGGIGNFIDRVLFGSVTDFLNLGIGSLRTGIFNVADMAIVLGTVLLFVAIAKGEESKKL